MDKELENEQARITDIQKVLEQKIIQLQGQLGGLKEGIIDLRKTFWEDVTVNIDEPDDVIETLTSLRQQAELLAERERTHGHSAKQAKQLRRMMDTPYFGRIDFWEEGEVEEDQIYIGISSLMDEKDEQFLIYDWRAPISSLYYDFSPGPASYKTPSGTIEGEMTLKRQYLIKNGQLEGMFDTGVTIGDTILQEVLGHNASTQMKNIVATIQKEQNHIIRNEKSKYLIVQGVAGSGKTSAAMQRIAYLLYRYRQTLTAEQIMLFSPNPLFNSYVATVLPELGEDNMEQTTYQQYMMSRLGRQFKVESPFIQMEYTLTGMEDANYDTRMAAIHYKSSLAFKAKIDDFIEKLSTEGLIFKNISFRGEVILPAQKISQMFYSLDPTMSIPNRLKIVMENILKVLNRIEKKEREKAWVDEEADLLDKEAYMEVFEKMQKHNKRRDDTFDDADLERTLLAKTIVQKRMQPIKNAIKKYRFLNIKAIYQAFFEKYRNAGWIEEWGTICDHTIERLNQKQLSYEDATAYLYLQDRLEGRKSNTKIRHLFIDEAQDYSPFQFEYLQQLFPNCKMTILGDINQAIYAHTMNAPTILSIKMEEAETITLKKSYRSTKQIVDFTKKFFKGGEWIEPFNRSGKKPTLSEVDDFDQLYQQLASCIHEMKANGHQTIAIICKSMKESKEAYNALKGLMEVHLMEPKTNTFEQGVIILPSYLAKGIEFDAVLIFNAAKDVYGRESERKLFYTACTRAMHELHLFSVGMPTTLLEVVPEELYDKKALRNG